MIDFSNDELQEAAEEIQSALAAVRKAGDVLYPVDDGYDDDPFVGDLRKAEKTLAQLFNKLKNPVAAYRRKNGMCANPDGTVPPRRKTKSAKAGQ